MDAYYAVVAAVPSAVLCPPLEHGLPHEAQALPLFIAGLCGCATLAGIWALRRRRRRRGVCQTALASVSTRTSDSPAETAQPEQRSELATTAIQHNSTAPQQQQGPIDSLGCTDAPSSASTPNEPATTDQAPETDRSLSSAACGAGDAPLPVVSGTSLNPRVLMMMARDVPLHASWAPAYDEQDA
ncbi:hypothetical protein pkur_cds_171 [Pandoravirus kuranda]|uniref:Uncharacterized protein n=1 Tax=Pandoravirus kuranda TaxID=3019033 RepID=A0AA95EC44_9VIRU|nr:hypothetical protein pkur_cds_171 [Pandoravirus kuranda]